MESILCPAKDKDLEKSILNINITIDPIVVADDISKLKSNWLIDL